MKKQKLKILLDYDDTVMLKDENGIYREHKLAASIIAAHNVTIYSGNPSAENYAKKHKIPYIFKGNDEVPTADVLIDDMAIEINQEEFADYFDVKESFVSIDKF
jgi:hypothetical protein